ncbi:MAG: cyclic pyranopterin monophosphate synthase MoaC [Bacteroidales bacterium]|nr:cyclic pyranopterin monophosphate synthase MoaC [Bacteroidales bacterium]HQP04231.1 cyclic pyranopterin monophosphate synthase MoaC [Bacteroidales bacterium]
MKANLSHVNEHGKANMVDISKKKIQIRTASAEGFIKLSPETINIILENLNKKGDVIATAEIAGIQGGKRTAELIPLCHNIVINKIEVSSKILKNGIRITSKATCTGQTGIEMEALTAVSVALLTVYDMCKAVDKKMKISNIKLLFKEKNDLELN